MNENEEITIIPLKREFHAGHGFTSLAFREQIALLYRVHIDHNTVTFLRTFVEVCQPGAASLDPDNPGADTAAAWERMDQLITSGVSGFFHTHPYGMYDWSHQDVLAQNGIAKATGSRYLFHGIQASNSSKSRFVCCCMINHRVFRFDCGMIDDDLNNPVITLKMPPKIQLQSGAYYFPA